jgi:alkaline phosphatase
MFTRRSLFRRSALTATGLAVPHVALSQDALVTKSGQKPKKIIHIVSDGMSVGTLTMANQLHQELYQKPLHWINLLQTPGAVPALMNTRSLNSPVTDSSAASTAWGSGSRVVNGVLNILPDERELTPLFRLFKQKGWKTALVTTAEMTHATPAGFVAVQWSRGDAGEIAPQYLQQGVDILLGGGLPHFDAKRRKDKRDLLSEYQAAGYEVVYNAKELAKADKSKKLLGLFAEGHLPYTIDQKATKNTEVPTIAEMVQAALERLKDTENFIMQVEGARIDHAAHNSDAPAALWDQIALDAAIQVCRDFQKEHPDTLIVVTTDHANSNPGLNGMDGGYKGSGLRFKNLMGVKLSYGEILKAVEKKGKKLKLPEVKGDPEDALKVDPNPYKEQERRRNEREAKEKPGKFTAAVQTATGVEISPKALQSLLAETTGYRASEVRCALLAQSLLGTYRPVYDQMNSPVSQLGQFMANWLGIGWTGNTHTSDYVQLVAYGPGAECFGGFVENTDIFKIYTSLAEIDFLNPSLPHYAGLGPSATEVEWV